MSKKNKIVLFTAILMFVISISNKIYAGTAYPKNMQIKAKIQSNGSMNVVETIVYNISGDLNGTYRDVLLTGENGASKMIVNSVKVDGKYFLYDSYTLRNGTDGKYNINDINKGQQIRVFMPSNSGIRTVELNYTLYDVITVYNDIAELYWNFIGDGWNYGIGNVDITIELPGDAGNDLKIYGHGPLNGNSKIIDNKTVNLTVSNLASKTPVDARLLFPTNLVVTSKKINEEKLQDILQKEQALAKTANKNRYKSRMLIYVIYIGIVIAFILPIITYLVFKNRMYKAQFTGEYYRELPEDYGPVIMNKCIKGKNFSPNSRDMLATLLDLVRRKYITIEEYKIKKFLKDKKDYKLTLVNQDLTELNEQEEYFVKELIFTNNKTETTLEDIKKENNSNTYSMKIAHDRFIAWGKKIENIAKEKEIVSKYKSIKQYTKWLWISIVIGIICIFSPRLHNSIFLFFTGFALIIEHLIVKYSISSYTYRTEKGIEHKAMWLAFKKFLLDFSNMKDYDEKSLVLWEHYLVYATGLGIAEKVIKNLKIKYPTEFNENNIDMNTVVLVMCLNTNTFKSFNSSFNSLASTAFSNPSSGSRSSGGFSGGGGGGRRWWRRRRLLKLK